MKDTSRVLKRLLRAIPAMPRLTPRLVLRRKRQLAPLVLGAIGAVIAGGLAAVLIFMPRTRHRALGIAKDGYGKVRGQLDHIHLGSHESVRMSRAASPRPAAGASRSGPVPESTGANYQNAGS